MNEEQYKQLVEKIGKEMADKLKQYEAETKKIAEETVKNGGYLTKQQYEEFKAKSDEVVENLKNAQLKQGTIITELQAKLDVTKPSIKTVGEVLKEAEKDFKEAFDAKASGRTIDFILEPKSDGTFSMRRFNAAKAAGTTGTVDGLSGAGSVASISQNLLASTLLRVGGDSPIISQYRNTQWVFPLIDIVTADFISGSPFVMWFEEVPVQGSAAIVPEGATKPLVQYGYVLRSAEYKKVAQLITFTEEFSIDFRRLEDDILNKGRIDTLNVVNNNILANIIAAATPYNTATEFTAGDAVQNPNDFDAIAAMAAQADNATFGNMVNAAIMSTFKKYRMGIIKSLQGEYLNRPEVLQGLAFVGNPGMAPDDIVVGDLRQYHMILRGGFIIRVGYNGTNFAENKFSVVMEQYYYDYISDIRKSAIVKGPTFADVKAAIGA